MKGLPLSSIVFLRLLVPYKEYFHPEAQVLGDWNICILICYLYAKKEYFRGPQ